jgi:hypothetical protein
VAPRLVLRLDIDRAGLTAVGAFAQVVPRRHVRTIEAETGPLGVKEIRRVPRAGMNGAHSSAAPSTSTGTMRPRQCSCSGVSVSLWVSTTTRRPSLSRRNAKHLRLLKGLDRGRIAVLTFDDLAFGLAALINRIRAL